MYIPCKVCVGEARLGEGVTSVIPADVCDGEVTVAGLITALMQHNEIYAQAKLFLLLARHLLRNISKECSKAKMHHSK